MKNVKRKGARSIKEVDPDILKKINLGKEETLTLAEILAADIFQILRNCFPRISKNDLDLLQAKNLKITGKMKLAGQILHKNAYLKEFDKITSHKSDIIRGAAAYMLAEENLSVKEMLQKIKPLADDSNPGVREWAWIALRPKISKDINKSIKTLENWVFEKSPNIRRYASEITRPRGVWCNHIQILKENPELGLPILSPLKNDAEKYVQDSVANWLNDAGKTRGDFVKKTCAEWKKGSSTKQTNRIVERALRNLTN